MSERTDTRVESAAERMARNRAELQRLLEPSHAADGAHAERGTHSAFPRSAIMRAITKNGGKTGLAMLAVALFAVKPRFALRLVRYLPVSALTKILVAQFVETRQRDK